MAYWFECSTRVREVVSSIPGHGEVAVRSLSLSLTDRHLLVIASCLRIGTGKKVGKNKPQQRHLLANTSIRVIGAQ